MRVLLVAPQFLPAVGGAERQTHALAQRLLTRGHQVMVLTQQVCGCPPREVLDGVPVVRAIRTVKLGPLFGLTYLLSVAGFLVAHRDDWDVVHVTHIFLDAYAAVLFRWLHGLPVVVRPACAGCYGDLARLGRFRAWPVYPGPGNVGLRAVVRTVARADAFIANSQELQAELIAAGFPAERIVRIPNGVDLDHFFPSPMARSDQSRQQFGLVPGPLLAFAGRLDPQKGLVTLLEALPLLFAHQPEARLLVMGDGPQRAELETVVRRIGISGQVSFLGLVQDVAPYLRAADIFVFPSQGEGMPNALLEAMASGLPCVASAIGGCSDIITDGQTGILVPAGDVETLRKALERLLRSHELRERLGAAAREHVVRRFGLKTMADGYEACLQAASRRLPLAFAPGGAPNRRP